MTFKSSPRAPGNRAQRGTARAATRQAAGVPRYVRGGHGAAPAASVPAYLQRPTSGMQVKAKIDVSAPNDPFEREADRAATRALSDAPLGNTANESRRATAQHTESSITANALNSSGRPLDPQTRTHMQSRFGADFGHVRVHTGTAAATLNRDLGANAFTQGRDIFFGAGHAPGENELTAHELAHVVQQTRCDGSPTSSMNTNGRDMPIQRSFSGTYPIANGGFEIDMQTREGAVNSPATHSGLDGYIRFVPGIGAPNSNSISMIQIVKLTDAGGTDVRSLSTPAAQAPRGALGDPGLKTADDPLRGVEGGFKTDVWHQVGPAGAAGAPQGSVMPLNYPVEPAAPGTTGYVGSTQQPASRGGGIGGQAGQTRGFKRSDDPADIKTVAIYDQPGTTSATANLNYSFETVPRGDDTMIAYGAVKWGFNLRAGLVQDEYVSVENGASATFDEALERHRDFYVHEPVTFYFPFDSSVLSAAEASKIDTFLPYLTRNPDVHLSLEGFADLKGGTSVYNAELSLRRAEAVQTALLAKGVAAARIDALLMGSGASSAATTDAGTGDEGGDAVKAADQMREENRQFNRRVILTFTHTATPAPAPTGP